MGVRKLNKFLTTRKIIKSYRNIQEFINKLENNNNSHNGKIVIAIDFWLYAHKFLHSCRSDNIPLGFWNQIIKFLSYGIIPLYVMDGSVPIEKQEKVEERAKKRSGYKKRIDVIDIEIDKYININDLVITDHIEIDDTLEHMYIKKEKLQKHIKRIKTSELYNIHKMFDVMGVPYIKAEFEADALCAKLFKENIITACLSDDMDMLALGCGSTIKFQDGELIEFNLKQVKDELKFTQDQFIDMCIMFGCDYLQHPFRLECDDVYDMIKKHGSLLDALCSNEHELFNMNNSNVKVIGEHYYQVKDTYLNSHQKEYIPKKMYNIKMKKIRFEDLASFLKKLRCFDTLDKHMGHIEGYIIKINHMIDIDKL
jgi:5'-3' exonuclease